MYPNILNHSIPILSAAPLTRAPLKPHWAQERPPSAWKSPWAFLWNSPSVDPISQLSSNIPIPKFHGFSHGFGIFWDSLDMESGCKVHGYHGDQRRDILGTSAVPDHSIRWSSISPRHHRFCPPEPDFCWFTGNNKATMAEGTCRWWTISGEFRTQNFMIQHTCGTWPSKKK